jgi:5-formyltetrahydrofolate cyclo-ligase
MDKASLRQQYAARRASLPPEEAARRSAVIAARLKILVDWEGLKTVLAYEAQLRLREVETTWLAAFLAEANPTAALEFVAPAKNAAFPAGAYDCIIVPLLAFDDSGHRLGFGGGWYDRFLAGQPDAFTVGLAYDMQAAASLPREPHDVALDLIVTETRLIK